MPIPQRVPPGAIAVVGDVPIARASFDRWLSIAERDSTAGRDSAPGQLAKRTVSFLIKAQWLVQEAEAERIDKSELGGGVSHGAARGRERSGTTATDAAFQARLDGIAEALDARHDRFTVTTDEVARYYATHRSQFVNPAVRDTLMVVTADRASALRAKAALSAGQRWAAVAHRWSIDSSAVNGGAFTVVEGVQSPELVRAVFAARPGQTTGPLRAPSAAQPAVRDYYLFRVTGGHPGSVRSLAAVSGQIRETLAERGRARELSTFIGGYEARWRGRTLCAPGYLVPECGNDAGRDRQP